MLAALSRMLGVRPVELDDALRSEPRARLQLTRRGLLAAGAAAVTAAILPDKVWSFPAPYTPPRIVELGSLPGFTMPADQTLLRIDPKFYEALVRTTKVVQRAAAALDDGYLFPGLR